MTSFCLILLLGLGCQAFAQTWNCTDVLDWNFFGSEVTQNNLGGLGPNLKDKQEIRYSGALTKGGKKGDLVVTVDTAAGPYKVNKAIRNGLLGKFGQINIQSGSSSTFKFQFVEAGTDTPFSIEASEKVLFSVYDLDAGAATDEHEFVQFITPVASHSVPPVTTVAVSGEDGDGTLYAESTRLGDRYDNPTDPLSMTKIAEESKISVTYVGKASWEIVFGDKNGKPKYGRNVLFAGRSQGDCACVGISDWTLHNNLQFNNLGGMGPVTTDPPELRYSNVFKTGWDQQPIDLVVKVAEGSTYKVANTTLNGLWPTLPAGQPDHTQMGQLNVKCGTETTFDFEFVKSGTNEPYNLSNVLFTVYDLDQHAGYENHEYVVFPQPVTNWTLTQSPPTEVRKSGQNDGTLEFQSTTVGHLDDNPTDPRKLTALQQSRSVTVWFSASSKFQVKFGHDYKTTRPVLGGRNVLFAGPGIYCAAPSSTLMTIVV